MEKFEQSQLEFVIKICKNGGASASDKDYIVQLYRLYFEPGFIGANNSACASCSGSILTVWNKVKDYVLTNAKLFVN